MLQAQGVILVELPAQLGHKGHVVLLDRKVIQGELQVLLDRKVIQGELQVQLDRVVLLVYKVL